MKSTRKNNKSRLRLLTAFALPLLLFAGCGPDPVSRKGDAPATTTDQAKETREENECTPMANLRLKNEPSAQALWWGDNLFSGKACTRYKNGQIHTLTEYENGVKSGTWEVYLPDGTLQKTGSVKDGKEDGPYREYYETGILKYEYHYAAGAKTGVWKSWYEDGTPYTERNFENDKLHGKVLVYDEAGDLAKEYDYRRGALVNSRMHFEEQ
ncbi:MAG: toxin-antitoxin system YwqK family antitoxin [Cryomorphaceae bacterium]